MHKIFRSAKALLFILSRAAGFGSAGTIAKSALARLSESSDVWPGWPSTVEVLTLLRMLMRLPCIGEIGKRQVLAALEGIHKV